LIQISHGALCPSVTAAERRRGGSLIRDLSSRRYGVAAALALLAAACNREDVTHFRVPKETPQASPATPAGVVSPGRSSGPGLRWTLPAGWTDGAGGQMRFATLKPPVAGKIDASVVVLPGPAGGELANVNRWRNQIGLGPLDEAGLAKARKVMKTRAGPLKVYDFTSEAKPRSRLVAGLTEISGDTWFVKMTGDADAVAAAQADFMKILGSLRLE
jgi:hypothetical protein